MEIQFFYIDRTITLAKRTELKAFIKNVFKREKKVVTSLTYVFCSDTYLLDINKQFLNHDYFTDIVTFNLSSDKNKIQGEIYISIDRVRDNANLLGVTIKSELHRVIFHGVLHLCGYKDKTLADEKTMRSMEDKYLQLYLR
ncbi:MAG TPA: rRNA maturation RNase YbeY [Ferruginibacter sp.]|jgi:probable rRNA maturation factor|nr:rRNA maturation RNase YbeY [Ferruginibacter sp.]